MATKDITDQQVCRAVQDYNDAVRATPPMPNNLFVRHILGMDPTAPSPPFPYEALAAQTGQPERVCYRALERAERRGLIEYGVSLRTGWLTDKGRAVLAAGSKED